MICKPEDSCFLLIDLQEKLIQAMPQRAYLNIKRHAETLLHICELLSIPVISTLQYPNGLGQLDPDLERLLPAGTPQLEKTRFSCVGNPEFDDALAKIGRKQIFLLGMESHICIAQTALDLHEQGFEAFVIRDGVCSIKRENHDNACKYLLSEGVKLHFTEALIYEWLRDSKHAHFKTISQLLRRA
ncbi:MAG: isochorismatase family protein [Candidatus Eutrophobiaceae bacterium]